MSNILASVTSLPTWGKCAIGITVAAIGASYYLLYKRKTPRKTPYKTDYKPNVVYVYQFPRAKVIPSISPFALKLETWLRMADIEYENVEIPLWVRSREGTLPFVELNGVEYVDSSLIIRDLTKLTGKDYIDSVLSNEQKAISRAFEQMVENTTFMSYGYFRYTMELDKMFKKGMAFHVPITFRLVMPFWKIKNKYRRRMYNQGIGRHAPEDIISIGLDDLQAISTYLGTKSYFHGDIPTKVDAFLFGVLSQIAYVPLETDHRRKLYNDFQNLVSFCDRMKSRFWPDWEECCQTGALNTWKRRY